VTLDLMPGSYAICRLDATAAVPPWVTGMAFSSITRTANELSIVCPAEDVPAAVQAQRGYRALTVRGPLDFSLVGIAAALTGVLAEASISLFMLSTYDTDYLFVRDADLDRTVATLRAAGHAVVIDA
jgi:hypothetical protein